MKDPQIPGLYMIDHGKKCGDLIGKPTKVGSEPCGSGSSNHEIWGSTS